VWGGGGCVYKVLFFKSHKMHEMVNYVKMILNIFCYMDKKFVWNVAWVFWE
jgi:hypothetical protein